MPPSGRRESSHAVRARRPRPTAVRDGGAGVLELQRARMLSSAVRVIARDGYAGMSVARVSSGARVSRRTFYDLFEDREDCFLAVFTEAVLRLEGLLLGACGDGDGWRERTRSALGALLGFLDREPEMLALLVVDALKAGPKVQERRSEILDRLAGAIHAGGVAAREGVMDSTKGGVNAKGNGDLPGLTGEGVVGAVFSVIHARAQRGDAGVMVGLLNPLMGVIVLPYLGPAEAERELAHPTPTIARHEQAHGGSESSSFDVLAELPMRVTRRTLLVLRAIAEHEGGSNREVGVAAGVVDQGQISKLLQRLEGLGLVENATPTEHRRDEPTGEPNAWRLTVRGVEVAHATRAIETETRGGQRAYGE